MSFERDFAWQRRLLPQIKRICGEHLLGEATEEDDKHRNTDLIWLRMDPGRSRIAVRIRRNDYLDDYGDQFTIRVDRPRGGHIELAKIIEGYGDVFCYAFASIDGLTLAAWMLGDLNVFRSWHSRELAHNRQRWIEKHNGDGTIFRAYRIDDLPSNFIITRYRPNINGSL